MFETIVPVYGSPINLHLADDIARMHKEFGIRRFVLIGPAFGSVGVHGLPSKEEFRAFGRELREMNQRFSAEDIQIDWWCVTTMANGEEHPEFQHIVNIDGKESPSGLCPLDESWRREFTERIRIVAETAHPKMILFEDDYELSNQAGVTFGCFCPLHLKALSEKLGKNMTRHELQSIYQDDKPENRIIKKTFTQIARDSVFLLTKQIRDAVNTVDSAIQLGVCEPIVSDRDGYLSQEEPRIFAGDSARPLIRVEGTIYNCENASSTLPGTLSHAMYTFERMPREYEVIHETDTCPHSRYFMSGQYFNGLLLGAVACGAQGTLLYGTQYLDDALEDDGYFRVYAKNAKKINALAETLKGSELNGLHIIYSPELQQRTIPKVAAQSLLPSMASIAGRFGIPYSTKNGSSALLIGRMAACLSDDEILELLSHGLILDAQAATNLQERGFGKYLGVDIAPMKEHQFRYEKLCDIPELRHVRGRFMYNYDAASAEDDASPYINLTLQGAEEVSIYTDYDGNRLNPASVRFENSLGGRIGIIATHLVGNESTNLFCYRKKELFQSLLEWVNRAPLPAVIKNRANSWILVRRSDTQTFFLITDLNGDDDREMTIRFAKEFRHSTFTELQQDGVWKEIPLQWSENDCATIPGPFHRLEMRIFAAHR